MAIDSVEHDDVGAAPVLLGAGSRAATDLTGYQLLRREHVGVAGGFSSLFDILATAEGARPGVDPAIAPIEISAVAARRRVTASNGMTITAIRTLAELDDLDVLVVAGLGTFTGPETAAGLENPAGRALVRALRTVDPQRTQLAPACTGVFALAETGILEGRRVITSWWLAPTFVARYPDVRIDLERMVVADGPVLTAGAVFAHIDLLEHDDEVVLPFEEYVRARLAEPFDTAAVATAIGASRRTLERRTRAVLGISPLALVQRMRLERAHHLRRTTDLSTEAIARRVGYANAETLRALQRRAARGGSSA